MTGSGEAVIRGRAASDGRLLAADAPLAAMQLSAGGAVDGPIVIPALAPLVRLAVRLGSPIERSISVAGETVDHALWVRLKPNAGGVDIAIVEREPPTPRVDRVDRSALAAHAAMALDGWAWQADRRLILKLVDVEGLPDEHPLPKAGDPLASYFRLEEGAPGSGEPLPLLSAAATASPFAGQNAVVRRAEQWRYALAGLPMFDGAGRFCGFRGKALPLASPKRPSTEAGDPVAPDPAMPDLGRRLDSALRQPLGRIVANANSIGAQLEGPLRADYVAYAGEIAAAGQHLLELVDDLADLQAIERADFAPAREAVDLADLARRAAGLLKVRAGERRIAIMVPTSDERTFATAEYRRVLQILVNLIGNAVRYSPPASQIWVRVDEAPETGTACVIVADQGRGIAPEQQERIFARFERIEPDDGVGGTGLGLYISRRLARAMGGDIAVDSALGQGARFTLTLPRHAEA